MLRCYSFLEHILHISYLSHKVTLSAEYGTFSHANADKLYWLNFLVDTSQPNSYWLVAKQLNLRFLDTTWISKNIYFQITMISYICRSNFISLIPWQLIPKISPNYVHAKWKYFLHVDNQNMLSRKMINVLILSHDLEPDVATFGADS